jgi:hypothetical protein
MIDLDAIEARPNAVGETYWYVDLASGCVRDAESEDEIAHLNGACLAADNADFIAHAPEDVRALIAEVRRLQLAPDLLAVIREGLHRSLSWDLAAGLGGHRVEAAWQRFEEIFSEARK